MADVKHPCQGCIYYKACGESPEQFRVQGEKLREKQKGKDMATNFEFFKDEILKNNVGILGFGFINGKICRCSKISCKDCEFGKGDKDLVCNERKFEWLYAEHIEAPKLTKRERAFCEAVQTGWIARDCDMRLHYYASKPELSDMEWVDDDGLWVRLELLGLCETFMFIKDTDTTPWSIEDMLKLEVQHETD